MGITEPCDGMTEAQIKAIQENNEKDFIRNTTNIIILSLVLVLSSSIAWNLLGFWKTILVAGFLLTSTMFYVVYLSGLVRIGSNNMR